MCKNMTKRCPALLITVALGISLLLGCGNSGGENSRHLEGSCEELLTTVYEKAHLDEDRREAMKYYETTVIDETNEEYILGTTELSYTDSAYSAPLMSSVAYQCVLLRMEEGTDMEAAKQLLADNADADKWVCVEAESIVVENVGDVILYVMADADTAEAIRTAFFAL